MTARTVHVPAGLPIPMPASGHFPYTWQEAAIYALNDEDLWFPKVGPGAWTIAECLEFMERYNGLGYYERGINSPYVWSFTNQYSHGLFVADNVFNPNAVSEQVGGAALLKVMAQKGYLSQNN